MDERTARKILDDNLALHDAPGYADFYEAHLGHLVHPWEQRVFDDDLRQIAERLPPGFNALDLGAGTGNLTLKLLAMGARVVAVDLSLQMLDLLGDKAAGKTGALDLVCADIDAYLTKCEQSFDLVAACSFYHHLPDYLGTLERAAARVAPGGFLYLAHEPAHKRVVSRSARALERLDFLLERMESRLHLPWAPPSDDPYYDPDSLADYWVDRDGLDHDEIGRRLAAGRFEVKMTLYDSKRHRLLHAAAHVMRTRRLVRVVARRPAASSPTAG